MIVTVADPPRFDPRAILERAALHDGELVIFALQVLG